MSRPFLELFAVAIVVAISPLTVHAQDAVELHSVILEDGNVRVEYSKNFDACAHLYRASTGTITHFQNLFCVSGSHVVSINPESAFRGLMSGEDVYLIHGNDSRIRSLLVAVTRRPTAAAGLDRTIECTSGETEVQLDGTASSDPDGDSLTYAWNVPAGVSLNDVASPTPVGRFPLGQSTVTLTVSDGNGATSSDTVVINVVDTTPPAVACISNPTSLSPANGAMVKVKVFVTVRDAAAAPEQLKLESLLLKSSEPDDAVGTSDGKTTGDTNGGNGFPGPVNATSLFAFNPATQRFEGTVSLRAERDSRGKGRIYTIIAHAIDRNGNASQSSCAVLVPLSGGKGKK